MKLYSNNYTLKTISNSNSNLHKKQYSKILIFLILIYKLLLIKLKFEMYLRAPSRCGGRRPGERCERPARVREPRGGRAGGGAGQRAGGRAAARAERPGGVAGGAGGRRRWRRGRSERAAALGDGRARFKGLDLAAG